MLKKTAVAVAVAVALLLVGMPDVSSMAVRSDPNRGREILHSRRQMMSTSATTFIVGVLASPLPVQAAADCFNDCVKNCKKIAPKDPEYCTLNCRDYCDQEDRADGLSGSKSADNGEVGILGGTFGQGTVPKGEDKPPSIKLPGLDFSSDDGKKLLGY